MSCLLLLCFSAWLPPYPALRSRSEILLLQTLIFSSKTCKVHTVIKERGIDTYLFTFDISIECIMQDSVSLEAIPYLIETTAEEIFSTDDSIEDVFLIDGITIDTREAILTNILINKPMSVTNEEFESEEEEFEEETTEEYINPAFASLKDLL